MNFFKRKSVVICLSLAAFFMILSVTAFGVWKYKKRQLNVPYELVQQADRLVSKGELARAKECISEALGYQPNNKEFLWSMVAVCVNMKQLGEAQSYAKKAWDNGKLEEEVFFFLVRGCGLDSLEDKIKYGKELLSDVADERFAEELKGDLHAMQKQFDQALTIYQNLNSVSESPAIATKIAGTYLAMKQRENAITYLKDVMDRNGLDEAGYILLSNLMVLENPQVELEPLIEHAKSQNKYNVDLQFQYGFLSTVLGEVTKAKTIFTDMLNSETELDTQKAREIRLLLGATAFSSKDRSALEELMNSVTGDDAPIEGERKFYKTLVEAIDGSKLDEMIKNINMVSKLLPDEFVVKVFQAKLDTASGKPLKALEFYGSINNPLYRIWPQIVIDTAVALKKTGESRKALGYIASFHKKRGAFTMKSALFERDLLSELNDTKTAAQIQSVVEESFPASNKLKMQGGLMALKNGEIDRGIGILKELAESNRDDRTICLSYAAALLRAKRVQEAIAFIDTLEPHGSYAALKAAALLMLGNKNEAELVYKDGIETFKSDGVYRGYSSLLTRSKRYKEAYSLLTKSAELFPDKVWPFTSLAIYNLKNNDIDLARSNAEKAQQLAPKSVGVATILMEVYFKKRMYQQSIKECNKVIDGQEKAPEAQAIKAMSLAGLKQFTEALPLLEDSVRKFPDNIQLSVSHVGCLLALKQTDLALSRSKALYESYPKSSNVVLLHATALRSTSVHDALEVVKKAESILSTKIYALQSASLLVQLKEYSAAIQILREAGDDPAIMRNLLYLELQHDDFDKALSKADKVNLPARDWVRIASDAQANNDYKRAMICYKKALELDSKHPVLLNNYAWSAWKSTGKVDDSILESSRMAATLLSDNVAILDTYAQLLLEAKKYDSCINQLRLQASNSHADPRLLYWLGVAYEKSGKKAKAVKVFGYALKRQYAKGDWILDIEESQLKEKIHSLTN